MRKLKLCTIIAALLLLLTSCSRTPAEEISGGVAANVATQTGTVDPAANTSGGEKTYGYRLEEISLEDGLGQITALCPTENEVYFLASVKSGEQTVTDGETGQPYTFERRRQALFRLDLQTLEVRELAAFSLPAQPEDADYNESLRDLQTGPDGDLWLLYSVYSYDTDALTDSLLRFSSDGSLKQEIPLSFDEDAEVQSFAAGADGQLYVKCGQDIHVLRDTAEAVSTVACEYESSTLCRVADKIGVWYHAVQPSDPTFRPYFSALDTQSLRWLPPVALPMDFADFCSAFPTDAYEIYYQSSRNGDLYGYTAEQTEEKQIDYLAFGVDHRAVSGYAALADGSILTALFEGGTRVQDKQASLVLLRRTETTDQAEKTCLKLACYNLDSSLIEPILAFNRANDACYIAVTDYADYDASSGSGDGLARLTTEILSGQVPDLFCTDNLAVRDYARQGVLLDLYSCMDTDPAFGREDFVAPLLDALELDGALYELPRGFCIETMYGLQSTVSDFTWTTEGISRALAQLQPGASVFGWWYTQSDVLSRFGPSFETFIDWDSGSCSFDSPEFIALLEFIRAFPDEAEPPENDFFSANARLVLKKQMLLEAVIDSFESYVYTLAPCGETAFVGYPGDSGAGRFVTLQSFAISTTCQDVAQAWRFVTSLLGDATYFPVLQAELDAMCQETMQITYRTDAEGNRVAGTKTSYNHINEFGQEDYEVTLNTLTAEQTDAVLQLIRDTKSVVRPDAALQGIVADEMEYLFAGECTAEQAAEKIQSRVELYLMEQGG